MSVQKATRDKYKTIARAKSLNHDELMDHVQSHMLSCMDPDCNVCDMGQSGSMIDDDDEDESTEKSDTHREGEEASEGRRGAGYDIDREGEKAVKDSRGDKHNLMQHGEHTSKHPGFKAVASKIANQQGVSRKAAGAILAARSRGASRAAKKTNPRLNRVRG